MGMTQEIVCPIIERVAYIIYFDELSKESKCIGTFVEQENDAGEVQYVFNINQSMIEESEIYVVTVPGIDITTRQSRYVRSGILPYFLECCSPRKDRGDTEWVLKEMGMNYWDRFEYMLRSRAITSRSNCYVGRYPTDYIDFERAKKDVQYLKSIRPNLDEQDDNVFHKIINS